MTTNFNDLNIHTDLLRNLKELGYESATPIQEKAIPLILEGRDLLGTAQTGTGKTAAFCLPLITKLLHSELKNNTKVLILTPTRELCSQIQAAIEEYTKGTKIKSTAVYGGVKQEFQAKAIREGAHIVVATPGRLLDLFEKGLIRFIELETLVLDEADRMLDMGFIDDISFLMNKLPQTKQCLLFSATMPKAIVNLAAKILRDPVSVEVAKQSTVAANIDQRAYNCLAEHKFQLLKKIIKEEVIGQVLVFTRTKQTADSVVEYLHKYRVGARAIHGDKKQTERELTLAMFAEGDLKVLVATDLVSRGIDVDTLTYVINFDLPLDPEVYVHRIGRTARAGRSGTAISFCEPEEVDLWNDIKKLIRMELQPKNFTGKREVIKLKTTLPKQVTAPTPGISQEKPLWYDHSKRGLKDDAGKRIHVNPAFKNKKSKKKR